MFNYENLQQYYNKRCFNYKKFLTDYPHYTIEQLYIELNPHINTNCPICNKPLNFINFSKGYRKNCSKACADKNINRVNKIKNTKLEKYGDSNYNNNDLKKQSCITKYGTEHPTQHPDIFEKINKNKANRHNKEYLLPSGKAIIVQGYENIFLDMYLKNNNENTISISTESKPIINYYYENKVRKYYPDFYIKNTNTIIEIKSEYTYKNQYNKNIAKFKSTIELGYNLEVYIIDKQNNITIMKEF